MAIATLFFCFGFGASVPDFGLSFWAWIFWKLAGHASFARRGTSHPHGGQRLVSLVAEYEIHRLSAHHNLKLAHSLPEPCVTSPYRYGPHRHRLKPLTPSARQKHLLHLDALYTISAHTRLLIAIRNFLGRPVSTAFLGHKRGKGKGPITVTVIGIRRSDIRKA